MNDFFAQYNDDRFTYNPNNKPELELARLREVRGWIATAKTYKKARRVFLEALLKETNSPVHAYFINQVPPFAYDSSAPPAAEFGRLAQIRGWNKNKLPYKRALFHFREAFNQEFDSDLDRFFKKYSNFDYNPRNEPKSEFRRLARGRWRKKSDAYQEARSEFFSALADEFDAHFGDENDLSTWESLCGALGVDFEPVPPSITQCKKRLEDIYVNIFDLVHHARTKTPFDFFDTESELSEYTNRNDLRYPIERAKSGPLKFILRRINSPRRGRR